MNVFILAHSDAKLFSKIKEDKADKTLTIKRVFAKAEDIREYLLSIIPVGGTIEAWMDHGSKDVDRCIVDIEIKYPDGSLHYYKIFSFPITGLQVVS